MSLETARNNFVSSSKIMYLSDLLLELSAKFSDINSGTIDDKIEDSLKTIGNYLNFDWVTLYEFPDKKSGFSRIYTYSMPSVPSPPVSTIQKDTAGLIEEVRKGKILYSPNVPDDPVLQANSEYQQHEKKFCHSKGIKTTLTMPLITDETVLGALYFSSIREEVLINDKLIYRLACFTKILANFIRQRSRKKSADYISSPGLLKSNSIQQTIIGQSRAFKKVLHHANQIADTDITVLLTGETGTGKGVIANAIHNAGQRRHKQMIHINCASLSPGIIESELFGHEKGAFTGAHTKRAGCFERADHSTLFMDEIGELPLELQAKLLRVLQNGEFERIGGSETLKCNVRIIAATNRCLEEEITAGKFRRDLYYRLNIFHIDIPPLRNRKEDIIYFIDFFLKKYSKKLGKNFNKIDRENINLLQNYSWPGNIRELENLVARSVINSDNNFLTFETPVSRENFIDTNKSLMDFEREFICKTLEDAMWKIEGADGAAERLNLKPSTLRDRMKKLNIKRP